MIGLLIFARQKLIKKKHLRNLSDLKIRQNVRQNFGIPSTARNIRGQAIRGYGSYLLGEAMKEIEELQEEVTINEMIDVLLLDQLNAIYHQHGSQSNYYAERRDRTRFALLNRFRELKEYKDAFEKLWEYCVDEAKHKTKLVKRISELEKEVENWKEF